MPKKINPDGIVYKDAALEIMTSFSPAIYPCKKCSWPVADGYVCQWCGDNDPSTEGDDDER